MNIIFIQIASYMILISIGVFLWFLLKLILSLSPDYNYEKEAMEKYELSLKGKIKKYFGKGIKGEQT